MINVNNHMNAINFIEKSTYEEAKSLLGGKFDSVLEYFLEDSAEYIENIARGCAEKNYSAMIMPAHSLKSSAKQLGAFCLSDIAKQIEEIAKASEKASEKDVANLPSLTEKLKETFTATSAELKQKQNSA